MGLGFWLESLGIFAASSDFWIEFIHPVIIEGNRRWWSRWHRFLLVNDFFRFYHNYFRDTTSWGVCRWGWLRYTLFDRISILSVEQAVYRPSTPYLGALSTFVCKMQDVVGQIKLYWILMILMHGICGCKEYLLSFLAQIFVLPVSILYLWWSVNWLHIRYDKCTRRNCSELTHCPAV